MRYERIVSGVDRVAFCGGFGGLNTMRLTTGGLRGTPLSGVPTGTQSLVFGMIPATRAPPCADRSISRALAHYARSRTPARLIAGNWYQNGPLSVFRASRREAEKANGKLFSRKIRRKKISSL